MKTARKFGLFAFLMGGPIWIVRIALLLGFLFILSGAVPVLMNRLSPQPGVDDAPWIVQTYSYIDGQALPLRVYYAKEYSVVKGEPAIAGYWYYDGEQYTYHKEIMTFPKELWGPVSVVRRPM